MTTLRTSSSRRIVGRCRLSSPRCWPRAACGGGRRRRQAAAGAPASTPATNGRRQPVRPRRAARSSSSARRTSTRSTRSARTTASCGTSPRFYARQLVTYTAEAGRGRHRARPGPRHRPRGKVTDGGKTYTYKLRDGDHLEDGTPITSKDVKYGIERIFAQDVLSGGPTYLQQVLDPKGEYKGPYKDTTADKLGLKADRDAGRQDDRLPAAERQRGLRATCSRCPPTSPVPQAKDTGAKYANKPFSSGPYKFQSYTPGQGR